MDVYERSRGELHQRLQQAIGAEAAGTLMAHLPPVGYSDLATKGDVKALEDRLVERLAGTEERLGLRMQALRQELRAEMHQMGRSLVLTMTTVMAFLLGVLFTALRVAG